MQKIWHQLLVYSGQTNDVRTAIINGRMVMDDRKLLTLNADQVMADADREGGELASRAGIP